MYQKRAVVYSLSIVTMSDVSFSRNEESIPNPSTHENATLSPLSCVPDPFRPSKNNLSKDFPSLMKLSHHTLITATNRQALHIIPRKTA